jgi:hypothetical protein
VKTKLAYVANITITMADKIWPINLNFTEFFSLTKNLLRLKKKKEKNAINVMYGIKTKRTCRFGESGIGRTAPRCERSDVGSGNFQPPEVRPIPDSPNLPEEPMPFR